MDDSIKTGRLVLRPWRPQDCQPFRDMSADPKVMATLPAPLSAEEADRLAQRIQDDMARQGWGLWALEVPGVAPFVGFCGLKHAPDALPFAPCVEMAWRLAAPFWGNGYATEAARAALEFGLGIFPEVVAFTAETNLRSRRVMERIGLDFRGTFDHPLLPEGHPLRPHVLFGKGQ